MDRLLLARWVGRTACGSGVVVVPRNLTSKATAAHSSLDCVEENFHQLALSPPELAVLCALIRAERGASEIFMGFFRTFSHYRKDVLEAKFAVLIRPMPIDVNIAYTAGNTRAGG